MEYRKLRCTQRDVIEDNVTYNVTPSYLHITHFDESKYLLFIFNKSS